MRLLILIYLFCITSSVYTRDLLINKIEVNGSQNYSSNQVIKYLLPNCYSAASNKIFEKLINLKKFSKIKITVINQTLILNIKEYPIIDKIDIYGDDTDLIKSMLEEKRFTKNNPFVPGNFQLIKTQLKKHYSSSALFNFDLNINLNLNKKTNKISIKIHLKKNDVFFIKKIFMYGANSETGKELKDSLITRNASWIPILGEKIILEPKVIKEEIQLLKEVYLSNGYIDFYIKSGKIIVDKNKHDVFILLDVHEGRQYFVNNNIIDKTSGNHLFNSELLDIMDDTFENGDLFDGNELSLLQKRIEMLFHYRGFVETKPEIEPIMIGEDLVDLVLSFKKTNRSIISKIHIEDNTKVTDMLLKTLTKQVEQSYCKAYYIDLVADELIKFGHATQLKYTIEQKKNKDDKKIGYHTPLKPNYKIENMGIYVPYEKKDKKDKKGKKDKKSLILDVKEKTLNKFIAGGSYQPGPGLTLYISTDILNFLGTGTDLTLKVTRSRKMTEFNIGFAMQDYLTDGGELIYSLYYKTNGLHKKKKKKKSKTEYGFFISKSAEIGENNRLTLQFACDKAVYALPPFRTTMFLQDYTDKWNVKHKEEYLTLLHVYDTLDEEEMPNNGILSKITLKLQLPSSDVNYYIFSWEFSYYNEIEDKLVLHVDMNFLHGNVYSYDDDEIEFPFFRNFHFSGSGNIRGYSEKAIGPKDIFLQPLGGNTLFSIKTSLYFPLPYLNELYVYDLRPSIFFDAGQVFNTHEYPDEPIWMEEDQDYSSFLRFSVGVEFLWLSPIGLPVELTFAHALNPSEIEETETISLHVVNKTPGIF